MYRITSRAFTAFTNIHIVYIHNYKVRQVSSSAFIVSSTHTDVRHTMTCGTQTHTHTHTHMHTCTHTHTHTRTHTHAHTHSLTLTHTHTHTPAGNTSLSMCRSQPSLKRSFLLFHACALNDGEFTHTHIHAHTNEPCILHIYTHKYMCVRRSLFFCVPAR